MITTIACPLSLTHPEVNPDTAPIWVDARGEKYRVASGIISAGSDIDPRILVQEGMDGLSALAMMGLTPDVEVTNG
jgi:hypothetical protein